MAKPRDRLSEIMHRRFKALRKIDRIDHQLLEKVSKSNREIPQTDPLPNPATERQALLKKIEQQKEQALVYALKCDEMSVALYVRLQLIKPSDSQASAHLEKLLEDVRNPRAWLRLKQLPKPESNEVRIPPIGSTFVESAQPTRDNPRELLIESIEALIELHRRYTKSLAR